MKTNRELLEFAVELAQQKRDFAPRELLTFRKNLEAFLGEDHAVAGITVTAELSEVAPLPEAYSIEDFERLQKDAYAVLNDVIKGKNVGVHSPDEFDLTVKLSAAPISKRKYRSMLFAYGSTPNAFLLKLFLLLGQEPADRVLQCKAVDCGKIFYRDRNQEFCSTRCTNRTFMKKLRKLTSYRESEKEQAHERYKRRMKKINPEREVVRRARKK